MRVGLCCVVVVLLVAPVAVLAQDGLRSASLPERTPQNPIPPSPGDIYRVPDTHWSRPQVPHRPGRTSHPVYGYGSYFVPSAEGPETMHRRDRNAGSGYLHLQLQPADAQVYVDGFYMGAVADFSRLIPGRSLVAGGHRVELRAPGYEPTSFDVMIAPNETVTYRADLRREPPAAAPAAVLPPAPPKTFYVIPGCYAGDKPPRARLPRGCDRSKLRIVPPTPVFNAKR